MSSWSNALSAAMLLQGTVGAALVDLETGSCMAFAELEDKDSISLAAVVNARMLRAQMRLVQEQKGDATVDDLLITFRHQYHLIRPVESGMGMPSMFLYLVMDRSQANLALTRRKVVDLEELIGQTVEIDLRINAARKLTSDGDQSASAADALVPAFMREDAVMRLLGLSSERTPASRQGAFAN